MRRAAWINQLVAAWLIGFVVFGLGDSATALEIAAHGTIALLLLLASWRVLTRQVGTTIPSAIQALSGAALAGLPLAFGYDTQTFIARHDFVLGAIVLLDGAIELWRGRGPITASSPRR